MGFDYLVNMDQTLLEVTVGSFPSLKNGFYLCVYTSNK